MPIDNFYWKRAISTEIKDESSLSSAKGLASIWEHEASNQINVAQQRHQSEISIKKFEYELDYSNHYFMQFKIKVSEATSTFHFIFSQ